MIPIQSPCFGSFDYGFLCSLVTVRPLRYVAILSEMLEDHTSGSTPCLGGGRQKADLLLMI